VARILAEATKKSHKMLRIAGTALLVLCVTFTAWLATEIVRNFQLIGAFPPWITPVISAVAVGSGAWFVFWQQSRIDKREEALRKRRSNAARAAMPTALAEINRYAEKCADEITEIHPGEGEASLIAGPLPVPQFPKDAIELLRDCVEYADEEDSERIAECIRKIQIQHSGIWTFLNRSILKPLPAVSFDSVLIDTIDLHAYCSSLYHYARTRGDYTHTKPYTVFIRSSAAVCNVYDERLPTLFNTMKRLNLIP
jgi:hypothetical protein